MKSPVKSDNRHGFIKILDDQKVKSLDWEPRGQKQPCSLDGRCGGIQALPCQQSVLSLAIDSSISDGIHKHSQANCDDMQSFQWVLGCFPKVSIQWDMTDRVLPRCHLADILVRCQIYIKIGSNSGHKKGVAQALQASHAKTYRTVSAVIQKDSILVLVNCVSLLGSY